MTPAEFTDAYYRYLAAKRDYPQLHPGDVFQPTMDPDAHCQRRGNLTLKDWIYAVRIERDFRRAVV